MGYFVILSALLLIVCGALSQDNICTHEVVDDCGYQLYEPLMNTKIIPVTPSELQHYCEELKSGRQCVKNKFEECPGIIPESTKKGFVEALGFTIDDICNNDGTQLGTKMLEHTPCVKEKLSNFNCTKEGFDIVEAANLEPEGEQLASLCCGFRKYERCYNDAVKESCGLPAVNEKSMAAASLMDYGYFNENHLLLGYILSLKRKVPSHFRENCLQSFILNSTYMWLRLVLFLARSIKAIISSLGLFMVERCFPYVLNKGKCAGRVILPLPEDTKHLKSILPGLFRVLNKIDS